MINKRTSGTAQRDDHVIRNMPHGCWDKHQTVSQLRLCHDCGSRVPLEEATILLLTVYLRLWGEAPTFVCLFHWSEHMIVTEGHVWTAGVMWKNFPSRLLQLLTSVSSRIGVWHCYGGERNHAIACCVSQPLLRTSSAPGFHHWGRHWHWCPWVNSLSGRGV